MKAFDHDGSLKPKFDITILDIIAHVRRCNVVADQGFEGGLPELLIQPP